LGRANIIKKAFAVEGEGLFLSYEIVALHAIHLQGKTGLQVGSLVLVDDILLGQLVDHGDYFREQFDHLFLVGFGTEFFDGITRGFCIIPVVQPFCFGLPDPFKR